MDLNTVAEYAVSRVGAEHVFPKPEASDLHSLSCRHSGLSLGSTRIARSKSRASLLPCSKASRHRRLACVLVMEAVQENGQGSS